MKKSHKKILKTLGGIALLKKLLPGLRDDKDFDVSSYMDGGIVNFFTGGSVGGGTGGGTGGGMDFGKIASALGGLSGGDEENKVMQGFSIGSSDINTPDIKPGNPEAVDDAQKDFNKFQQSLERDTSVQLADGGIAGFANGGILDIDFEDDIFEDKDSFGLSKSVAPEYDATTGKYVLNGKEYDSISDAANDTENINEAIRKTKAGEMANRFEQAQSFMPEPYGQTEGQMIKGTGASKVDIQRFRRGGMADERKFEREREFNFDDYMFDDFDFSDIDFGDFGGIINLPGGGGGYSYTPPTEEEIAEQKAKQAAARLAKGYGGSGAPGRSSYGFQTPGASISIDARDETPDAYRFYPSEVSKLYSQMKGTSFSPLVAPPKEATYVDDLQPRRIASQLYAADGKFVDRSELITGPGGERGDKIPAMLSDGEFVVNAEAVRGMGVAAGANPQDEYEQRLEGARQMYALQKEGEQMMRKYR